jgi:hypothetical protein
MTIMTDNNEWERIPNDICHNLASGKVFYLFLQLTYFIYFIDDETTTSTDNYNYLNYIDNDEGVCFVITN